MTEQTGEVVNSEFVFKRWWVKSLDRDIVYLVKLFQSFPPSFRVNAGTEQTGEVVNSEFVFKRCWVQVSIVTSSTW